MRQSLSPVGGFYKDPDLHWSAQDVLNWIPVPAERAGTRTKWQFRDAPGLKPFVRVVRNLGEGGIVDAGPIRGMRSVEDKLFVVAGTQLYQITNSGVAIPYGNVPGVGRVSMAHNQRGAGNQLLVVNGSAGYVFDTSSLVFQKVTDGGYPGAFIADFVDGYLVQVEPQGRYWFHSDLSNALEYNTLDQYEAEADPDRIVTLHVSFREVLVFGKDTIEPYVNSGAATGTFTRASNTVIQCGCSAKFSPKTMDNSVFFLDDKRIVRRLDGYTPVRVSTVAIEAALAECSREEIAAAFAYTFEDRGHKIYYLTVPGRFTFGYDVLSQEWHRRGSPGMGRLRLNDLVFWNGKWIGGDFQRGRLYELDWNYMLDACDELERERVTGVLSADQQMIEVNEVELVLNVGTEISVCQPFAEQPEGPEISGALPDGAVGISWAGGTFTASGGRPPYSFSSRPGTYFPGNLGPMSSAGIVSSKIPTENGVGIVKARVTDANGLWSELTDEFVIASPTIALVGAGLTVGTVLAPTGTDFSAAKNTSIIDGARWLAAGPDRIFAWTASSIEYSTDFGVSWAPSTVTMSNGGLDGIYWNAFYIVGNTSGGLVYSTDNCATFATIPTPTAPNTSVIAGSDTLLLVASGSSNFFHKAEHPAGPWTQGAAHTLFLGVHGCMASNGTEFRAGSQATNLGPPKIVRTQDGSAVNPMALPAFSAALRITCMKWASPEGDEGGVWVAGTDSGEIIYDNGSGWQLSPDTMDGFCNDVNYNGAFFIMCATNVSTNLGTFKRSEDGVTWVTCTGTQTTATALAVLTDD